jgi:hypothetical protein
MQLLGADDLSTCKGLPVKHRSSIGSWPLGHEALYSSRKGGRDELNSQIQKIKRMACGFRNVEHFKTAIYPHWEGLDLYLCCTRERQRNISPRLLT